MAPNGEFLKIRKNRHQRHQRQVRQHGQDAARARRETGTPDQRRSTSDSKNNRSNSGGNMMDYKSGYGRYNLCSRVTTRSYRRRRKRSHQRQRRARAARSRERETKGGARREGRLAVASEIRYADSAVVHTRWQSAGPRSHEPPTTSKHYRTGVGGRLLLQEATPCIECGSHSQVLSVYHERKRQRRRQVARDSRPRGCVARVPSPLEPLTAATLATGVARWQGNGS